VFHSPIGERRVLLDTVEGPTETQKAVSNGLHAAKRGTIHHQDPRTTAAESQNDIEATGGPRSAFLWTR
jgi:hypothetical protein